MSPHLIVFFGYPYHTYNFEECKCYKKGERKMKTTTYPPLISFCFIRRSWVRKEASFTYLELISLSFDNLVHTAPNIIY